MVTHLIRRVCITFSQERIYMFFFYVYACSYNAYDNVSAAGGHVAKSQKDSTKGWFQDILFPFFIFSGQGSLYNQDPFVSRRSVQWRRSERFVFVFFVIIGYREHISQLLCILLSRGLLWVLAIRRKRGLRVVVIALLAVITRHREF